MSLNCVNFRLYWKMCICICICKVLRYQKHRRMGHGFRFLLPPFLYYSTLFQNFHINHSFFKIFIIIRFSSFDNISRRHTSWIIRAFVEKLWTQNTRICLLILSCNFINRDYTLKRKVKLKINIPEFQNINNINFFNNYYF